MNIRNLGGLYVVQITNTVLPVLTVPYLARTLGVDGFGLLSWVTSATFLLVLACDSGINGVAVRALIHRKHSKRAVEQIFTATQFVRFSLALAGSLLLWLTVLVFDGSGEHLLLLSLGLLNVMGTIAFPTYYYVAAEQSHRTAMLHLVGRSAVVLLIFLLVRERADVAIAVGLQSAATLLSGVAAHLIRGPHRLPRYRRLSSRLAWVLVQRAKPSYIPEMQTHAMGSIPVLVLGAVAGAAEAGIFAICDKVARTGYSLFQPFLQASLPKWTRMHKEGTLQVATALHDQVLARVAAGAVYVALTLFLGANIFMQILAGPRFADVSYLGTVLRCLSIWMVLHVVARGMEFRGFVAAGRNTGYWIAMRWPLLVQWVLLIVGVWFQGALGAAIAIGVCEAFFVYRINRVASRS